MLNQARYFLPGMTSDNCQKITSWNGSSHEMLNEYQMIGNFLP